MADRAKQFIEQFDAAVKIMLENAPADLSVCVSIYARDCANRTTEQPD